MSGILKTGAEWLAGQLLKHTGQQVTYSRGAASVTLKAGTGQTLLRLADDYGATRMEWTDRDYLVRPAELKLDGSLTVPQRGDRISETVNGTTKVYEVNAPMGEPPWRWTDGSQTLMRIHTKQVS